jgi:chromosome segregation protein
MDFVWGLFDSTEQAILEKHSFVTQEGTGWIAPGFLIRPASEKTPYIGHLTRKSELESLTHLVQEKQQALSAIEASITTVADRIADIEMQIRNSADEKIAMEKQLLQHQTKIEQQERMQKDLCSQLQRICLKIDQEQALLESLNEQAVEINDRLEGLKEEQKTMQEVQESGQIAKEQQQAELDALTAQFQSLHIQKATSAERLQASLRELTAQEQQLTRVQRRLVEINQMLARNEQMEQGLEDSDESLTQSIQELSDALQVLRQSYQEFQNQSEILNQQMTTLSESVKDLQKSDTARQQKLLQLQVQNERLLAGQTRITDGLIERYGNAILEQIATASPSEQDFEPKQASHNQKQLDALKEQLAELGEVNFASIREYDEAKQRFEHLSQERKDLQDSLLHLEQAIEHINKTSEQRFEQAFKAIAERFEKLFPIIFGGGHARLQLVAKEGSTDPADLGVDILAQPPGKKVSNITLLSGGEKALTAVSLIFAIFMVKPSPFCVLDEVDAPLDDANIGRFNALLREMSHKSQFILITHNKKTMELNNTLYGVTMEEPGVSKMVSIQLH